MTSSATIVVWRRVGLISSFDAEPHAELTCTQPTPNHVIVHGQNLRGRCRCRFLRDSRRARDTCNNMLVQCTNTTQPTPQHQCASTPPCSRTDQMRESNEPDGTRNDDQISSAPQSDLIGGQLMTGCTVLPAINSPRPLLLPATAMYTVGIPSPDNQHTKLSSPSNNRTNTCADVMRSTYRRIQPADATCRQASCALT